MEIVSRTEFVIHIESEVSLRNNRKSGFNLCEEMIMASNYTSVNGKYFGTEIEGKWWKRYTKGKMLSRGNGTFLYDKQSISFLRKLTKTPISIDFEDILEIKSGKWHAGQWAAGRQVIKVIWKNNNQLLSSGFTISKTTEKSDEILSELINIIKSKQVIRKPA